ncbi:hypothetical protein B0H17DRAFT_1138917 [Mycena rosella]|uniref:Uncharacterized protein n=1 Tax=Mycena rosella TaxID=1033263 RepID=A0AAD7D6U7_MYCRO|nr:hypothetical protein B0H17DRAFT_1138917 [Mycena rosella]
MFHCSGLSGPRSRLRRPPRDFSQGIQSRNAGRSHGIHSIHARPASPSTYTATAATSPSTPRSPAPPLPKPPALKSCELTVSFDRTTKILALSVSEIKGKVAATIAATGVKRLKGVAPRGIKILPRSRLLTVAESEKATILLKQSVPRLDKSGSLIVPKCQIVVDAVPMDFKLSSPSAAHELYMHNRGVITDPSAIIEVHWLNPKVLRTPNKKASSLLVILIDTLSADRSITQGLVIASTLCYPHQYEEEPLFCFNCQQPGMILD